MSGTIVALATPTGRSGIGVVRLSGPDSLAITRAMVGDSEFTTEPRTAHLRPLGDPLTDEIVDEAIVTYFKAPHSFTGDDVVEISCHGSPVILRQVIDICLAQGARMAAAGEFTLRALANGRMNLTEAEAIRDLIEAQTAASARQAVRQMRGELSLQLQPLKDDLLNVIVVLESAIEFVEDDLPKLQLEQLQASLHRITTETRRLADTFKAGHLIREGLKVALVGRPNAGKSSLFNSLLGTDRAIVTDIAGTTRDQLYERFTVDDVPILLIDTAGLQETTDTVESIGVERSRATIADADIVVVVVDASESVTREVREIIESVQNINHIVALNKTDKISLDAVAEIRSDITNANGETTVAVSALTGSGLEDLKKAILAPFLAIDVSIAGFMVTDARHRDLLLRAETEMTQSSEHLNQRLSEEIVLLGLHNALRYLGEITGETTTEDVLTRIFSTFCIGK
ncbi:MAG: tRNA uridine-5-carboxymethylaminomethyl(34) synthesis GTPase MnmE [Pyrinomonadaceae bacterium]